MSFRQTELHALKEGDTILLGIKLTMEPITGTVITVREQVKPSYRGKAYDIGSHMVKTLIAMSCDGQEVTNSPINIFREEGMLDGRKQFEKVYMEEIKQGDKILFEDEDDNGRQKYGIVKTKKINQVPATLLKGSIIEGITKTELEVQTREGIKEVGETYFYKKY